MSLDGSGLVRLTVDPAPDWDPVWSPDGRQIAFRSIRAGDNNDWEIYVMNVDGTVLTKLTENGADDSQAVYQP